MIKKFVKMKVTLNIIDNKETINNIIQILSFIVVMSGLLRY